MLARPVQGEASSLSPRVCLLIYGILLILPNCALAGGNLAKRQNGNLEENSLAAMAKYPIFSSTKAILRVAAPPCIMRVALAWGVGAAVLNKRGRKTDSLPSADGDRDRPCVVLFRPGERARSTIFILSALRMRGAPDILSKQQRAGTLGIFIYAGRDGARRIK